MKSERIQTGTLHKTKNSVFVAFYTKQYHHYQTSEICKKWGKDAWYATVALLGVMVRWDFSMGFVGGAVDSGESLLEAVTRECKEEVGYNVAPERLTPVCSHYMEDDGFKQNTHFYICEVSPEEIYAIQTKSTSKEAVDAKVENSAYAVVHMVEDSFTNLGNSKWAGTGREELEILFESGLIPKPKIVINGK